MPRYINSAKTTIPGKSPKKPLSVIVLSSFPGYRMRSFGPKSLFKIGSMTIIEHQISYIKDEYPHSEFIVVSGYEHDKILKNKNGYRIVENIDYENNNSIEEVRLGISNVMHDNILILSGDLIINEEVLERVIKNQSTILVDNNSQFNKDEVGIGELDGLAINVSYSLPNKWCDILFITGKELDIMKKFCSKERSKNLLHEALQFIIESGGKLNVIYTDDVKIKRADNS